MKNPKEINVDSMLVAIATIIRDQKEFLHMTVDDIAEKSGVSKGVISDLMTNRGRVPSLANFIKIAMALELPEDIFTSLIQGKFEQVQNENNCTREDVKKILLKYGLNKKNAQSLMAQIDAVLQWQCNNTSERIQFFN